MRFKKIQIPAYGPFTGLEIDLPDDGGDFHLFCGPNEAGKSSLLRSLRALLFGIHAQTADDFLHGYKQMLIAAELEKKDGTSQFFQRRKGNKNTLLDLANSALNETEIMGFLGGVDEAYFDSMFGLGSVELREGADALLKGEGRLGEALFSASLGGTPVDKVLQSLETEAAKLFKGRAGSSIRASRHLFDECLKLSKESIIKADEWEEVVTVIQRKTTERTQRLHTKQELQNRKAWLERCRDALPLVGQHQEHLKQLAEITHIPDLSHSFAEEIREARREWHQARNQIEPLEIALKTLREQMAGCKRAPEVIAEESEIDRLHTSIGAYRDQKQTLVKKQNEAAQAKQRIETACADLEIGGPIDKLESHRISQVRFLEAEQKAEALTDSSRAVETAVEQSNALSKELEKLKGQLTAADTGDVAELEQAVSKTSLLEEVAETLPSRLSDAAGSQRNLERLHKQLPGSPAEVDGVHALEVPSKSTIEQARENFVDLTRHDKELEKRRSEEQSKLDRVAAELERLQRQRNLPSLDDLKTARDHRETGWQLVIKAWKHSQAEQEFVAGVPLEEAYPQAVIAADDVADRLRTEAEAVAMIDEKRLQLVVAEEALADVQTQKEKLANDKTGLDAKWAKAWAACHITPLSPREMSEWRDVWVDFCRSWDEWTCATRKIDQDKARVAEASAILQTALAADDDNLSSLLSLARAKINEHNKAAGAEGLLRRQLEEKEKELEEISEQLPQLRRNFDDAQASWSSCLSAFSLPSALSAERCVNLMRSRKELFADYDQWLALSRDCDSLNSQISANETSVAQLVAKLKLESQDTEDDEAALWKKLNDAKGAKADFDVLNRDIHSKEREMEAARLRSKQNYEAFNAMLLTAAVESEDNLDGFLQQLETKTKISDGLRTLRDTLSGLSRKEGVEPFIERVGMEADLESEGALSQVDEEIATLDTEIEGLRNGLQELTNQQRAMEAASDESARQAQRAELELSRMQQDAERFARLQFAISLLKSRIDRFREQNQGPFMEKASHWFSEITDGAFSGITTQYNTEDRPVIAGQRAGEGANLQVAVHGMSEGTRDQLFLALRLAGLELHLEDHEPMPLILDDLLVNFDDDRALRALTALRSFGQRSQVLLFTHHAHLIELVEKSWGKGSFHLHPLGNPS